MVLEFVISPPSSDYGKDISILKVYYHPSFAYPLTIENLLKGTKSRTKHEISFRKKLSTFFRSREVQKVIRGFHNNLKKTEEKDDIPF
ncbi:MAG: hypothetical protein DRH24_15265 [Deltaproteobacteria bacterium]|nr:MAG: hypothetical protein DRH24_15265 [Deltaproteobacteria bacterium]